MKPRGISDRFALIVLSTLSLFLASCPRSWAEPTQAAESALLRASLRLMGRYNAAHACVIDPRIALTNGHVLDLRPFDAGVGLFPFAWSDGSGASGFVIPMYTEKARDLGAVQPLHAEEVFPHYLPIAANPPKTGDRLFLLGFDWSNRKNAMGDDVIEARVTRVVALHVLFYPSGKPGSSGSCVVNEAGEVVAINEGGYGTDDGNEIGLAIGVWGELSKLPED